MIKSNKINNANTTTIRLDSDIFRDFRAICLTQNKKPSTVIEALTQKYTVQHIDEVSKHLKAIARKIKDG